MTSGRMPRALVIGGRRGIGAAVVQALTAKGMDVTYTYRTAQVNPGPPPDNSISPIVQSTPSPGNWRTRCPGTRWYRSAAPPTTRWRR